MCGITGFWQEPATADSLQATLQPMIKSVAHRGPDAEGHWISPEYGVGLGHRRLSILDLSPAGSQPMHSECRRYTVVFNGEIYNFQALREALEAETGQLDWNGHSDTEVLLRAIGYWGLRVTLRRTTGMFALALWDAQCSTLTLARDRFGEKPLFYAQVDGTLVFGSELKALHCHPVVPGEVDPQSVGLYLRYGYVPAPHSIYRGIFKVLPGQIMEFRRDASVLVASGCSYWEHSVDLYGAARPPSSRVAIDTAADALHSILRAAVHREMIADVPLGAFLSGGVDSSLIVALMQRDSAARIRTFTIGFDDPAYDEAPYAREIARHLGTEHVEQYVGKREIFDIVPELPQIYDEPLGDSSQIPMILLARVARRTVAVCLSGDGGDELFGGYNHYRWGPPLLYTAQFMAAAWAPLAGTFFRAAGLLSRSQRLIRLGETVRALSRQDALTLLNAAMVEPWRVSRSKLPAENGTRSVTFFGMDYAEQLMAFDVSTYLADDILAKVDRATMSVGLEARAPYLDHGVARFAWSLPRTLRSRPGASKVLLKELLSRYVPRTLFERPKRGFGLPLQRWFRQELRPMAKKYLIDLAPRYDEFIDPRGIARLWGEHESGRINRQRELWVTMSLLMWLEQYVG